MLRIIFLTIAAFLEYFQPFFMETTPQTFAKKNNFLWVKEFSKNGSAFTYKSIIPTPPYAIKTNKISGGVVLIIFVIFSC